MLFSERYEARNSAQTTPFNYRACCGSEVRLGKEGGSDSNTNFPKDVFTSLGENSCQGVSRCMWFTNEGSSDFRELVFTAFLGLPGDLWRQHWLQPKKLLTSSLNQRWARISEQYLRLLPHAINAFIQEVWHSCAKVDKPLRPTPPVCSQFLPKETQMGKVGGGAVDTSFLSN